MQHPKPELLPAGVVSQETLLQQSGLEFLRGMLAQKFPPPPIGERLNFWPLIVDEGFVVFEGEPDMSVYNPIGVVHGGYTATLLDSCMACAVHSTLPAGRAYTTMEVKINFVRAVTADIGRVRAEGKVLHVGRTMATAEGKLFDAKHRLLAHATTTCLIFDPNAKT
jgi:uncharacterized protein (TIGR00369 family)